MLQGHPHHHRHAQRRQDDRHCSPRRTGDVAGEEPIVVKLAQTGEPEGQGALATIHRLTGCEDLHEFARHPDALPPAFAARRIGAEELTWRRPPTSCATCRRRPPRVRRGVPAACPHRHWSVPQLAEELGAKVTIVTASPGTLNAVELTLRCAAPEPEITGIMAAPCPRSRMGGGNHRRAGADRHRPARAGVAAGRRRRADREEFSDAAAGWSAAPRPSRHRRSPPSMRRRIHGSSAG